MSKYGYRSSPAARKTRAASVIRVAPQVTGSNALTDDRIAARIRDRIALLPGAVDTFVRRHVDYPTIQVNEDRVKADESELTQGNVADSFADLALLERPDL